MKRLILFDDGGSDLGPLGDLRCSFQQRTGVYTGMGRAERSLGRTAELHAFRGDLDLCREQTRRAVTDPSDPSEATLVNGRLLLGGRLPVPSCGSALVTEDDS
ncbi:MAG: hypothetical protein VX563_09435, partial [Planctomycetota bacterium]|nr:hypothetical protein [Planctomycetota bacterium]